MIPLAFKIDGEARPKGSKSVGKRGQVYETNKKTMPWVETVKTQAKEVMAVGTGKQRQPFSGPVKVRLRFYMKRPKNHYCADGSLKWWAPLWKQTKPDADKLARAVLDGLHPFCIKDDSQVAMLEVLKTYCPLGQEPAVSVEIREL